MPDHPLYPRDGDISSGIEIGRCWMSELVFKCQFDYWEDLPPGLARPIRTLDCIDMFSRVPVKRYVKHNASKLGSALHLPYVYRSS